MRGRGWLMLTLLAAASFMAALPAQAESRPDVRLRANYPDDQGAWREQVGYLLVLHARYEPLGLNIRVGMGAAGAEGVRALKLPFDVAEDPSVRELPWYELSIPGRADPWVAVELDGVADLIEAALKDPVDEARIKSALKLTSYVSRYIDDGPAMPEATARLVEFLPHCGFAHACRFVDDLWYRADLTGARADARSALQALAADSWPLVQFCDLALRADAHDRALAAEMAVGLQRVVSAEPQTRLARLTWLRAVLRAEPGEQRVAEAEAMLPLLQNDPRSLLTLAEIVMGSAHPLSYRAIAGRALDAAAQQDHDARWLNAARFKLALRCGDDEEAAARLREAIGEKDSSYALNSEAWWLLNRFETMGRFDELALAMMLHAQEKGALGAAQNDTLGLALFANGRFDEAVAAATEAVAGDDPDVRFRGRLLRFERTRAVLRAR